MSRLFFFWWGTTLKFLFRKNCLCQCVERSLRHGSHWMWQHADAFSCFNQNDWERAGCRGSFDDARFQGLCFGSQFNCNRRTNRHEPMVYHWRCCHHCLSTKRVHYVSKLLFRKLFSQKNFTEIHRNFTEISHFTEFLQNFCRIFAEFSQKFHRIFTEKSSQILFLFQSWFCCRWWCPGFDQASWNSSSR